MELIPRHQCLIYSGAPSRHLPALAALIRDKLAANYRCLYLNSPPMVAGIRPYLEAAGVDVRTEIARAALVLSSDRGHLVDSRFDSRRMLNLLRDNYSQAISDGYESLWASGDMSWEFGPAQDFAELVEYERGLEDFFKTHPKMAGVCQYHADTLPSEVVEHGRALHPAEFVNETLSRINPAYRPEHPHA